MLYGKVRDFEGLEWFSIRESLNELFLDDSDVEILLAEIPPKETKAQIEAVENLLKDEKIFHDFESWENAYSAWFDADESADSQKIEDFEL
jgi:hypothetical protein